MLSSVKGNLKSQQLLWKDDLHACGIVAASRGYPGAYKKGVPIYGGSSLWSRQQLRSDFKRSAIKCVIENFRSERMIQSSQIDPGFVANAKVV